MLLLLSSSRFVLVVLGSGSGVLLVQETVLIVGSDLMKESTDVRVGLSGVRANLGQ